MGKIDITQLEQTETVPAGSLHLVEMGNGSGTKAVTQEVLEEKIRGALKVGDLKTLQTENKENLVGAINEVAQSGGGGNAVDILDNKEEIEANTGSGKVAGALAVKEMFGALNDKLGGLTFGFTANGQPGWKDGADTVHPFSEASYAIFKTEKTVPYNKGSFLSLLAHSGFEINADGILKCVKSGNYTLCIAGNDAKGDDKFTISYYVNGISQNIYVGSGTGTSFVPDITLLTINLTEGDTINIHAKTTSTTAGYLRFMAVLYQS